MTMQFAARTSDLIDSPIGAAFAMLDHRVNDRPLLDLSQAAPGYSPAPVVADRIAEAAAEPNTSRYAPAAGLPELRDEFAAELRQSYIATDINAGDVTITAGCNQAFCATINALAEPGDSVVVATPFYFNHDMWLRAESIGVRHLRSTGDLLPDVEHAAELIDATTRAILLVSPGNPTGVTIPANLIADFVELAARNDIALILDETYRTFRPTEAPAHAVFDNPDWRSTFISLHSFSKDLAIPGYRVGAIVSGAEVQRETLKVLDCVAISAPRIGQEAAITGLRHAGGWRREQAQRIARLEDHFRNVMASSPGGFELMTSGAYFGWVRSTDHRSTDATVRRLIVEFDTLVIPGTAFTPTDEGMLRFSFANLTPAEIDELGHRLASY
jgi:aspartate/methionine/tyrosine aminotransferase